MKHKTNANLVLKLCVAMVIVFLLFYLINIQMDLNKLKTAKENLAKQIDKAEDRIDKISIRIEEPLSDEYIERAARELLGYRKPGEIIYYNDLAN